MGTATQPLPVFEGIGDGLRRNMSRQQREAQSRAVLVVNTGIDRWTTQRDFGSYVIPERHVWTPTTRCAVCSTEKELHDAAMDQIAEQQAKYPPKPSFRAGIGPHDFVSAPEACDLCLAPKALHSPTGRYGVLVVRGTMTAQDWGDRKKQEFPVFSDEIAQDLIREQQLQRNGVFMCRAERPTEAELKRAEKLRNERWLELVKVADADYMRYHSVHVIPDEAKRACEQLVELGLLEGKRDWLYAVDRTVECLGCGERVRPNVATCRHCGAILDREKAIALGIPGAAEAPEPEAQRQSRKKAPAAESSKQ